MGAAEERHFKTNVQPHAFTLIARLTAFAPIMIIIRPGLLRQVVVFLSRRMGQAKVKLNE